MRARALVGEDVSSFQQWGMALFVTQRVRAARPIVMVRRHRATVRAGDFELYKFLVELGLVNQAGVVPASVEFDGGPSDPSMRDA